MTLLGHAPELQIAGGWRIRLTILTFTPYWKSPHGIDGLKLESPAFPLRLSNFAIGPERLRLT